MKQTTQSSLAADQNGVVQAHRGSFLYLIFALAAVTLIYNQPLWQPYLFADEMNILDPELSKIAYNSDLWASIYFWTKIAGRPVTGIVTTVFHDAFAQGDRGVLMLRRIALLASLAGLCGAFYLLRVLRVTSLHAAFLCVFLWSQPSFAVHHAYLLLFPYWIGIYCALASFALFHSRRDTPFSRTEGALHVALFGIALLTFQPTAFIVLPFLALMALLDDTGRYTKRITLLFGTLLGTVLLYTAFFKLGSMVSGLGSYVKARNLMTPDSLDSFTGSGYLRIFEFWNYPAAVHISAGQKDMLNWAVLLLFLGIAFAALLIQARASRPVTWRWALITAMFGMSLLPIVAEGGGERQHMAMTAVTTWVLIFYGSAVIVAGALAPARLGAAHALLRPAALILVCVTAIGASLGLNRAIIEPYGQYLRGAQKIFEATGDQEALSVIAYLPSDSVLATGCPAEPCSGFFGRRVPDAGYMKREGFYTFAAISSGVGAQLDISVLPQDSVHDQSGDTLIIDWASLVAPSAP